MYLADKGFPQDRRYQTDGESEPTLTALANAKKRRARVQAKKAKFYHHEML